MDCPNSNNGGSGDKSLPSMGMGVPRWMKRATERYDYSDICASPPSSNEDGFIHINRNRLRQIPATDAGQTNVECYQKQQQQRSFRTETADITASVVELERHQQHHHHYSHRSIPFTAKIITAAPPAIDCNSTPVTTQFFKAAATSVSTAPSSTNSIFTNSNTSSQSQDSSASSKLISSPSVAGEIIKKSDRERGNTYDSALSSGDVPSVIVSKPERERGIDNSSALQVKEAIEKMNGINLPPTPDQTPNPTPTVTPACSPQVARRNPFFSGNPSQSTNNSGNWLFRSSSALTNNKGERVEEHNYNLYEAKAGVGGTGAGNNSTIPTGAGGIGGSTTNKPPVRYVPRPSELRELNFWSPTSM